MSSRYALKSASTATTLVIALSLVYPGCGGTPTCHDAGYCPGDDTAGKAGMPSGGDAASGASSTGGSKGGMAGTSGKGGTASGGIAGATVGGSPTDGGAGGAEGGAGGVPVVLPCDGACMGNKPVCKEATDTCVECLLPSDCNVGVKTKCDTASNSCVECLALTDCKDAKLAKCDVGSCVKCTSNDDCVHIVGKGVCDTKAGECVQCTASDETACAGKSCNPATKACTTTSVGSLDYCQPCVADSECLGGNKADPDARCVPMTYAGAPRPGGFCLRRVTKTCARPFKTSVMAASLSGVSSEAYCGIDQDNVRCEAVLDLIGAASCADTLDTSCGCLRDKDGNCTTSGKGGLCRTVGVDNNRCTYVCGTVDDCPTGKTCTGGQPYCH